MKSFKCPNCGEETISLWKKANLDVRYTNKCKKCNCSYGPAGYAWMLSIASVFGFYYILANIPGVIFKVLLCILVAILSMVINIFFIPVVKK